MEWVVAVVSALVGGVSGAFVGLHTGRGMAYLWGVVGSRQVLPFLDTTDFSLAKHCANNGRMFGFLTGLLSGIVAGFITSFNTLFVAVLICSVLGVLAARSYIISAGGYGVHGLQIGAIGGAIGGGSAGFLVRKLIEQAVSLYG